MKETRPWKNKKELHAKMKNLYGNIKKKKDRHFE